MPEARPAITSIANISQNFGAKGSSAEVIAKIRGSGEQNPARAVQDVQEDDEDAAEHGRHVERGWNPGGFVETQTEGAAEVRQSHADQAGVQRGNSRAQEYSHDPYVWVGVVTLRGAAFGL